MCGQFGARQEGAPSNCSADLPDSVQYCKTRWLQVSLCLSSAATTTSPAASLLVLSSTSGLRLGLTHHGVESSQVRLTSATDHNYARNVYAKAHHQSKKCGQDEGPTAGSPRWKLKAARAHEDWVLPGDLGFLGSQTLQDSLQLLSMYPGFALHSPCAAQSSH